ncbi:hypothetical protein [Lactobacillus delbrueckii]|uniref:hypothetical protein n=1 Tax=Lactobacillus delbrueckii TaxID=1584 RepID=UPI001CD8D1B3|nr:hypothetical protein [Lactobacillus delbrueckii]
MPIYKYLLSILTTISALAGAFLAASSGLPAYLAGQPLKAGIFAVLCLLEGLSAYLLWWPGKRALAVLNGGLLAAALLLFWQGEGLAAGSALVLLAINYLLKREETWAWTLALVLNLVFAALTMLPHQFMSFPAA